MKKLGMSLTVFAVLCFTVPIASAGSIRVESDAKYYVDLKCRGSSKTIEIRRGTTTVTFQSSSNHSCDIVGGGVSWPVSQLEDNGRWKIKSGKAKHN